MASRLAQFLSSMSIHKLMKVTIRQLREIVRKSLRGSQPEESYDQELMDDPALKKSSVYVPNHVKKKIKAWARDMKLSSN